MSHRMSGDIPAKGPFKAASRMLAWAEWVAPVVRHPLSILAMAAVAALLCGMVLHPRGLALAAGLTVVMIFGAVWPWISLGGVRGDVHFGRLRAREGDLVETRLTLRNRAPWAACGLAIRVGDVEGCDTKLDDSTMVTVAHVAGWRTVESDWSFVPPCRGYHPIGGVAVVTTGFPFGLQEARRRLVVDRPLLAWPRTFPVGPIPEEAGGHAPEGASVRDRAGDAGDMLGVRAYRRGDPLRRVHWSQTARHGELIVCELQASAAPRVQIVVDIDPTTHENHGPDGSLEWAVRVAASFLEDWIAQGADVELIVADQVIPARGGTVAARKAAVLDALSLIRPGPAPPLTELLAGPACRRFGRGLRLIICADRALAGLLRPTTGSVSERFVVLDAAAFASEAEQPSGSRVDPCDADVRPWLFIDDPRRVAQQVLWTRKEARRGA